MIECKDPTLTDDSVIPVAERTTRAKAPPDSLEDVDSNEKTQVDKVLLRRRVKVSRSNPIPHRPSFFFYIHLLRLTYFFLTR